MELPAKLLALVSSVTWDGGDGVLRALRDILREDAPFDAGEVALSKPPDYQRWTLTDDDREVAADDLLERAASGEGPVRIDDAFEAGFASRTRERMAERGLRSCLALPLSAAGGPDGAIVVAREHGWAFTAVSLHTLWPVAAMTGLALARAIALTALKRDADHLRTAARSEDEALRKELAVVEADAHALRRAAELAEEDRASVTSALRAAEERWRTGRIELEAMAAEAERWRLQAAELDLRLAEREKEPVLPPPRRRRRSRTATATPEGEVPPSGSEPGTS